MLGAKFLHANGYRYKFYDKSLPAKAELIYPTLEGNRHFKQSILVISAMSQHPSIAVVYYCYLQKLSSMRKYPELQVVL